jgi:hypothetical protein
MIHHYCVVFEMFCLKVYFGYRCCLGFSQALSTDLFLLYPSQLTVYIIKTNAKSLNQIKLVTK